MKFYRVYVELTNICGLACSFCPPKTLPTQSMSLSFFEHVLDELTPYTKEIAYHIGGDALTLSNLKEYLDLTCKKNFKVMLTTSGYYLSKHDLHTLLHPAIKQINISLNSYNKNALPLSFEAYMEPIMKLCALKVEHNKDLFINLRLWNMDEAHSEETFNKKLFSYLENIFHTPLHVKTIYEQKPRSIRLGEKILLHFDDYFEWPSLHLQHESDGTCQGLSSHIGILSNGKVVPCCLDKDGVIELGDLHVSSLGDILNTSRTKAIIEGFKRHHAVENLCQKCTYKHRFKEK
ncbi:radical SAM/SPASM domain-containing protein [Sulfurospirillum oryzae]|uniref:radical SAM/SPASM domain-containing protein n=1 Tax=Sulfurospirillum oryzae TaxID=2976535 RepID=UPI0021E97EDC|nr:radical SAM protein [Sulfurospirillum oryzae]